ncbi:hypothetical protein, partial [Geomicrobium sp. JCM 19055]|uniref:hypothetical protein n=1 Tax=Geomicrobium sp. JCM 19055 TaxID=1460649 RepID=UPI0005AACB3F
RGGDGVAREDVGVARGSVGVARGSVGVARGSVDGARQYNAISANVRPACDVHHDQASCF